MSEHALTPHSPRPPLRPRGLTDLVELVPYLLGFHPRDSLVVVALCGPRRRVGVTMRVDLPEARRCEDLPGSLAAYLRHDGAREALALVYDGPAGAGHDPSGCLPDLPLVRALGRGLTDGGIALVDALYVGAGRWWSYACTRPGCCPAEGRALPGPQGKTSPAVAAATYAGMVALPCREDLERTLELSDPVSGQAVRGAEAAIAAAMAAAAAGGITSSDRDGVPPPGAVAGGAGSGAVSGGAVSDGAVSDGAVSGGAVGGDRGPAGRDRWRRQIVGELAAAVDRYTAAGRDGPAGELPEDQVARFLVALRDDAVRDACCDWVEGEHGERALDLWRYLTTRAVPPYDVTPLSLVAWSAWHAGAGPLARIAVDRTLARDPACRLALLLAEALDRGVNPSTVRGRPRGRRRRTRLGADSEQHGPGPGR